MRAVVQRVREAAVAVDGEEVARIGPGFLVLLGVEEGDTDEDQAWLLKKVGGLRIMEDGVGKMNLALRDVGGEALVISQFTLLASCKKGSRPGFTRAAPPDEAQARYERFARELGEVIGKTVPTGVFAAEMQVSLINDGPVTIVIDSRWRE